MTGLQDRMSDFQPQVIGSVDVSGFGWPASPRKAPAAAAAWEERDHPRVEHGEHGGEFTRKGSPGNTADPKTVFRSLAKGEVEIEPGSDPARTAEIAAALDRLPAPVKESVRGHLYMVSVSPKLYYGGNDNVAGMYLADLHSLLVATKTDQAAPSAVHEALHAYDAGPRRDYAVSGGPEWKRLAADIRQAGVPLEQSYAADWGPAGTGDQEMFAELGMQHVLGLPLVLDRRENEPLPGALAARVRALLDEAMKDRPS